MPKQRWGVFSIQGNSDPGSLAQEVLLYDRLVIPVPAGSTERTHWQTMGWNPELLEQRIEQLGPVARPVPWNKTIREIYTQGGDVLPDIPYETSRRLLVDHASVEMMDGVRPLLVPAYRSWQEFAGDFLFPSDPEPINEPPPIALLGHRVLAPALVGDLEAVLKESIRIAQDRDFRRQRADLYERESSLLYRGAGCNLRAALEELSQAAQACNRTVQDTFPAVDILFAFALGTIRRELEDLFFDPYPEALSLAPPLVTLASLDHLYLRPLRDPNDGDPAAMFHETLQGLPQRDWWRGSRIRF